MTPTTLLLLPGLDGTEVFFRPLFASLPEWIHPRVICFPSADASGYADLLAVVRQVVSDIPTFFVLGSSFAGPLALMLAEAEPEKVKGVILATTFVRLPRRSYACMRFLAIEPAVWLLRACRRIPIWLSRTPTDQLRLDKAETWKRVSARVVAARIRALLTVDVRQLLKECPVPILCIAGESDRVVPQGNVDEFVRLQPSLKVQMINGGHFVLYTNSMAAAEAISTFMQ